MVAVIDFYAGWDVDDVSAQTVGWDLTCTDPVTGGRAFVKVKGVRSTPTVLLTANELKAARAQADWRLAVVTRVLSAPNVVEYSADQALAAAVPYVYRAVMPKH